MWVVVFLGLVDLILVCLKISGDCVVTFLHERAFSTKFLGFTPAMAIYQIFVKTLDGTTQCLQISSPTISGEALKRHLAARTAVPSRFQRLVSGFRLIQDETLILASSDGFFPSINILSHLPGGKGGFGSLLRGAATKAGQKKTNNFDACRDMSGRRLRHVNAEKKIEEWKAEADDRKLEKLAEQYLKKVAKEKRKDSSAAVTEYVEKYKEDTAKCMEEVEESVRQSFSLYKESKRKILPSSEQSSKRFKIWLGKNKMEGSDSETDDSDDEDNASDDGDAKSVVLDGGNHLNHNKADKESLASGSGCSANSDEESLSTCSERGSLEEERRHCALNSLAVEGSSVSGSSNSESDKFVELQAGIQSQFTVENRPISEADRLIQSEVVENELAMSNKETSVTMSSTLEDQLDLGKQSLDLFPEIDGHVQQEEVQQDPEPAKMETALTSPNIVVAEEEPLILEKYNSAAELEVLGLERLKAELQAHGLKCGGTLQERTSRLFLLKTTPLDKLPKKLFAKPSGGQK